MIVIVTIVTVTHMLPTCVGHPQKPFLLPHPPQPVICVYCGSSEHRSMECRKPSSRQQGGRLLYPVQHPVGTLETNNVNLLQHLVKVHKSPMLGPEMVTNLGPPSDNSQRPETGRQQQQQPQCPIQGKPNNQNKSPYRDYRYSDQPRQT